MTGKIMITVDEANKRDAAVHAQRIGDFLGVTVKTEYKCPYCKNVFTTRPHDIWNKKTRSCGCIKGVVKTLSQKEVNDRDKKSGWKAAGVYVKSTIKRLYYCPKCGKKCLVAPYIIWCGKTSSCGHCKDPDVGDKFGRLTITRVLINKSGYGCQVEASCQCGNTWSGYANKLYRRNTTSCGCFKQELIQKRTDESKHSVEYIKDEYQKRKFEFLSSEYLNGETRYTAKCHCGKIFSVKPNSIVYDNTASCGHCNDPNIGDKFNKLTVVKIVPHNTGCSVEAICECGNKWWGKASQLSGGNTQSCGCIISINNNTITQILKKLNINFQTEKSFEECRNKIRLRFDFYLPDHNLLIEFHGKHHYSYKGQCKYHKNADKNEMRRIMYNQRKRDGIKIEFCVQNNINLLAIPYTCGDKLEDILSETLEHPEMAEKITARLHAKTSLKIPGVVVKKDSKTNVTIK
jgi:hypothetical protein